MLFKKNVQKTDKIEEKTKTVLKIKTVDDIPVIKEMRKKIGNGERKEAIIYGYTNLKNDYTSLTLLLATKILHLTALKRIRQIFPLYIQAM